MVLELREAARKAVAGSGDNPFAGKFPKDEGGYTFEHAVKTDDDKKELARLKRHAQSAARTAQRSLIWEQSAEKSGKVTVIVSTGPMRQSRKAAAAQAASAQSDEAAVSAANPATATG